MCGVVQVLCVALNILGCPQYHQYPQYPQYPQLPSASSIAVSTLLCHKTIDGACHQRIRNNHQLKEGKQYFVGCVYFVQFHFVLISSSL